MIIYAVELWLSQTVAEMYSIESMRGISKLLFGSNLMLRSEIAIVIYLQCNQESERYRFIKFLLYMNK